MEIIKIKRLFFKTLSFLMIFGFSFVAASYDELDGGKYVPSELIVKFKVQPKDNFITVNGVELILKHQPSLITVVELPSKKSGEKVSQYYLDREVEEYLKILSESDNVEYVQPNYRYDLSSYIPNDTLYFGQWNMANINASSAWSITRGLSGVRIGVIDTGRGAHPDLRWDPVLAYNAATNVATISAAAELGYEGAYNHGTHVAGIIGARINNSRGVAGVCGNCTLVPIRITNAAGGIATTFTDTTTIANALKWAVVNELQVVNMSFERAQACDLQPVIGNAIKEANAAGVAVVVAAGNHNVNTSGVTPASCSEAITVGATLRDGTKAPYSSYGNAVDVMAPGGGTIADVLPNGDPFTNFWGTAVAAPGEVNCSTSMYPSYSKPSVDGVISTWRDVSVTPLRNCYRAMSGTSMAAPHVSGTVGLMLSRKSGLRPEIIKDILTATASPIPSCPSGDCGGGQLDVSAAVNYVASLQTGPCSYGTSSVCQIDALTSYKNTSTGEVKQYIHAYNRIWKANEVGTIDGNTQLITLMDKYKGVNKPCSFSSSSSCKLDTLTKIDLPEWGGYVESITAYGRAFNFNKQGVLIDGPYLLTSVPRFASGPCSGISPALCTFDTRVLFNFPGIGNIESINAYGRYYNYNLSGVLLDSGITKSVPRYAAGPCAGLASSAQCNFQARSLRTNSYGEVIETVIAYGKYYEWKNDVAVVSGLLVKDMLQFK